MTGCQDCFYVAFSCLQFHETCVLAGGDELLARRSLFMRGKSAKAAAESA